MPKDERTESEIAASQPVAYLPFDQWQGKENRWAISIGVTGDATFNIVKNGNDIVRTMTIKDLVQNYWAD